MKTRQIILSASLAAAFPITAHGAIVAVLGQPVGAGVTERSDTYPSAGTGFYVPSTTGSTAINRLGYWDKDGDGLAQDHTVGLYRYNGTNYDLLAEATVLAGTASVLDGGYRWVAIPELTLPDNGQNANYYGIIASHSTDAWTTGLGTGAPMNASFGTVSSNMYFGAIQTGPTYAFAGGGTPYGGANFGFESVPEPSSMLLLGVGLVGCCFARRKRG